MTNIEDLPASRQITDHPDRELHAEWLADTILSEIIGHDLFQILEGDIDLAADIDTDGYNKFISDLRSVISGAVDKDVEGRDVLIGNIDGLKESLASAFSRAASWGYIWGRLDQINDMHDTNDIRLVRAKNLGKVVAEARTADPELTLVLTDVEDIITTQRGIVK